MTSNEAATARRAASPNAATSAWISSTLRGRGTSPPVRAAHGTADGATGWVPVTAEEVSRPANCSSAPTSAPWR